MKTHDYCVAAHDSALCGLKKCQSHIFGIADKNLDYPFKKTDCFCLSYLQVDCSYIFVNCKLIGNVYWRVGEIFERVEWAVAFKKLDKGVKKMCNIVEKKFERKVPNEQMLTWFEKPTSVQAKASVFVERAQCVRRTTEFKLDISEPLTGSFMVMVDMRVN